MLVLQSELATDPDRTRILLFFSDPDPLSLEDVDSDRI